MKKVACFSVFTIRIMFKLNLVVFRSENSDPISKVDCTASRTILSHPPISIALNYIYGQTKINLLSYTFFNQKNSFKGNWRSREIDILPKY